MIHSIMVKLQFQDFARAPRSWTRALTLNIAYDTPHKISFRMSGRSSLYDLQFSQTLRHKFYISLSISIYLLWICLNFCSGKRKFQGPLSQLVIMLFTWNFEDGLIDHQPCFIQNFKFLVVQEPTFQKSKFGQNRPLTVF